jgi:YD repeat-containing protein
MLLLPSLLSVLSLPSVAVAADDVFYEYDERDRLTHVVSNGTEVVYAYDDVGNRFVVAVPEPGGVPPLALGVLALIGFASRARFIRRRPVGRRVAWIGLLGLGAFTVLAGAPSPVWAQTEVAPGAAQMLPGFRMAQPPDPAPLFGGTTGVAAASAVEAGSSLAATHAGSSTETTPEIESLARALRHDVDLIYEFVASQIAYDPIWGSHKGALGTLLDREGGDFDQASLMIALLRASGHTASYVYGKQRIEAADLVNWLGVSEDSDVVANLIGNSGRSLDASRNQVLTFPDGSLFGVDMERVWVEVRIDGTDYVFDPAFKVHTVRTGIDLGAAMGYDRQSLLGSALAGATVTSNSVQSLNDANLRLALDGFAANLADVIRNDHPGATIDEIIGGREILPPVEAPRQTSVPGQQAVFEQWAGEIPAAFRACLRVALPGFDETFNTDALAGRRLTIFYESNRPVLRLDGVLVATGTAASAGTQQDLQIEAVHPFFTDFADQSGTMQIKAGGSFLVLNDWTGSREGRVRHHELRERILTAEGGDVSSEPVLGESLAVFAASWLAQVEETCELNVRLADAVCFSFHNVGIAGQTDSPFVDIPFSIRNSASNTPGVRGALDRSAFFSIGGHSSVLEGGVIEQLQPELRAVSTVALAGVANDQSSSFFDVTAATFPTVQPQLLNYSAAEVARVQSFLDQGARVLLPRNGNLTVDSWTGLGFLAITEPPSGGISLGYIITGGLNGGFGTTDSFFDSSSTATTNPVNTSSDPIDLVTGDFLFDEVDLTVGSQPFPLGLAFKKSYNSAGRHVDGPLGLGWSHNFDLRTTPGSDGFQAAGKDSPLDAVATLVETFVSLDLLAAGTSASASELLVAMLAQRWFMDQRIDNTVTIQQPDRTSVFVRLPDGTFSPPPGSASTLIKEPDGSHQLITKQGLQLDFRAEDGRITSWRDPNANSVSFTYSADKLQRVDDAAGHSLTLTYAGDHVSVVSDGTRSFTYGYDTTGNLTSVTNTANETTTFAYAGGTAEAGLLESVFTPANPTNPRVFNTYDALSHVTTQLDSNGHLWSYHIAGSRSEEIDPSGASKVEYYDQRGRKIREIDALGFETLMDVDGEDRVVLRIEPEGNFSQLEYDDRHNLTKATVFPKPGSPLDPIVREMTYEPVFNQPITETDPLGHITRLFYDGFGNLTRLEQPTALGQSPVTTFTYNGRGQVLTQTDAEGTETAFGYDPATADLLTRTDDVGGLHVLTSMTYDDFGNVTSVTDPRGNRAIFTLDFMRRVVRTQAPAPFNFVTRLTYDDEGHLTLQERQMGDPAPWQTTAMSYTLSGKLETATDPSQQTTTTTYDSLDRVASQVDAKGRTTQLRYTPRGNLERTLDPMEQPSKILTYTPNGQVASVTDANGHTTTFEYDGFDRLDRTVFANGTFEQLAYDAASNVVSKRLRSGQSILFQYDALGRMLSKLPPDDFVIIFGYDRMGRLTSEFQAGGVTTFQYDALGRLIAKTDRNSRTVAYQYDGAGNRIRLTYPNGHFITYEYDELNRLRRIREAGVTEIVAYGYDSLSRRTSTTRRNGTSTTRVWELDDDLGSLTHQLPGGPATWTYGYDAVHNRTSTSISAAQFNCKCSPYPVTNRDRGTEAVWP